MPVIKEEEEASMLSRRLFAAGAAGAPVVLAGAARAEDQAAESTIDRVKRAKVLRIAALPGEAPYFNKDLATATGRACASTWRRTLLACSTVRSNMSSRLTAIRCS